MDEKQPEIIKETHTTVDYNLPAVVAGLEMLTVNANLSPVKKKRVLTRRMPRDESNENLNRRCSLRPRKRTCAEMEDDSSKNKSQEKECTVKKYYLNRSLKRTLNNLETIYEEKDDTCEEKDATYECTTYMSVKRYKRMIQFQDKPTNSKLQKRRAKIKRVFGSKINFKRKCASMQVLLDKLNGIIAESPVKADSETK